MSRQSPSPVWPPLLAALVSMPRTGLACSGPDAMGVILRNERTGWLLWGAALLVAGGVAAAPQLRARGFRERWPLAAVVVFHPGWWMSARAGDCGFTLRTGSWLMTGVALLVAGVVFFRARGGAQS